MGTMRLVVLAAALAAVACAGSGDDGALLNFLRGGAQKITTSGRGGLDIENGAEQKRRDETVTRTPESAMKEMQPKMENEYDRPRVVSETGEITEGKNNATLTREKAAAEKEEKERLKALSGVSDWQKVAHGGDSGFSPNVVGAMNSSDTERLLTKHTDGGIWHDEQPHYAKCPGNIFCDKRFKYPEDQIALLHEYPEARTFKLDRPDNVVPQRDALEQIVEQKDEDAAQTEDTLGNDVNEDDEEAARRR